MKNSQRDVYKRQVLPLPQHLILSHRTTSAGGPFDIHDSLYLAQLVGHLDQLLPPGYVKRDIDRCGSLLAGSYIDRSHVNLLLCKYLGYIHQQSHPVSAVYLKLRQIQAVAARLIRLLPLCVNQPFLLILRQINNCLLYTSRCV